MTLPPRLRVGELTRQRLVAALDAAGVHRNAAAQTLLEHPVFDAQHVESLALVERSVQDLGFAEGAPLSAILAAAGESGLAPCPAITGPYLRLAVTDQASAPDAVLSNGRAPSGSVTVASVPLDDTDELPKGFYLRVIDGVPWLRGYHATDAHIWSPADRFAFRIEP